MRRFLSLLERFRSDERGAFLALFGILAVVLIALSGAVVDYTSVEQARTRAQVALDAAALALQPEVYKGTAESVLKTDAKNLLINRIADTRITADVTDAIKDTTNGTLTLKASLQVPMYFVQLIGINTMNVKLQSQSTRGSMNLEVAVALDTTGSMSGSKISDLRTATSDLIDLVVQDTQTPTYTRMALVPYSMGVNVGSYASTFRGPNKNAAISGARWLSLSAANISAITKANPARVTTSTNHGLSTGNIVYISGIADNGTNSFADNLNGRYYTITWVSNTRFTLNGVDSSSFRTYSSNGGTTRPCITNSCQVVVTTAAAAVPIAFADGETLSISGVNGMTAINANFATTSLTSTTFALQGTDGRSGSYGSAPNGSYTSGGTATCYGYNFACQYQTFNSAWWGTNTFAQSTCVTERVGAHQYDDAGPSTTYVGRNYPSGSNPCLGNQIVPLTDDNSPTGVLHTAASNLVAQGSTAGQVGLAWAWYMISPNFLGSVPSWPPSGSYAPVAYATPNTLKVVILMTDGDFNSVYCNGVISADSVSGSGSVADHIDCNASNGSSYTQAQAQCDAMKKGGDGVLGNGDDIIVYTVGFDIADQPSAQNIMANCATDAAHAYIANSGTDLQDAFRDIGQKIQQLRISQ
jgi:Flp pilus assembly protein TadG